MNRYIDKVILALQPLKSSRGVKRIVFGNVIVSTEEYPVILVHPTISRQSQEDTDNVNTARGFGVTVEVFDQTRRIDNGSDVDLNALASNFTKLLEEEVSDTDPTPKSDTVRRILESTFMKDGDSLLREGLTIEYGNDPETQGVQKAVINLVLKGSHYQYTL